MRSILLTVIAIIISCGLRAQIVGPTSMCVGSSISLSSGTAPLGGTWSSSSPVVASVNQISGIVMGVSTGIATITYMLPTTSYWTHTVVVNPVPAAIIGPSTVCVGGTAALSDPTPGGMWTASNSSVATITSSGMVTGVSPGSITITYTLGSSCFRTHPITVVTPSPVSPISGITTICAGMTTQLSCSPGGGTWSSSSFPVATVNVITGLVSAAATSGTTTITYIANGGCGTASVTTTVFVNAVPPITGSLSVCVGQTTQLSNTSSGGVWSTSNSTRATVSATGVMGGVSAGSCVISYIPPGCSASTTTIMVNPLPTPPAAMAPNLSMCTGTSITLSNAVSGGAWSLSNTGTASITTGGQITAVAAGTTVVSYITTNSCGPSAAATTTVTINQTPMIPLPTPSVCVGVTTMLSASPAGGTWSSSNTGIATVNGSGAAGGVAANICIVTYTRLGCIATSSLVVNTTPALPTITPATAINLCAGNSTVLTGTPTGGVWSSGNSTVATVTGGTVWGASGGSVNISYTVSNHCGGSTVSKPITVHNIPSASFTVPPSVCVGTPTVLIPATSGGVWTSSNTTIATVSPTGIIFGVTTGVANIIYTLGSTCAPPPHVQAITVGPGAPSVPAIAGAAEGCAGTPVALSNSMAGGVWSSSNTSVATVNASTGVVTGITAGSTVISYSVASTCASSALGVSTHAISFVNSAPAAGSITGANAVCITSSITLTGTPATGTWSWSSSAAGVATVNASGVVTGLAAGTTNIFFTRSNACGSTSSAAHPVTVNIAPTVSPLSSVATVCVGSNITLSNTLSGGTWSTTDATKATVSSSGVVYGVATGSVTINYLVNAICFVSPITAQYTVSVSAGPAVPVISAPGSVCVGNIITMSTTVPGGTWSSGSPAVATIDATGAVTGAGAGSTVISYMLSNSCGTTSATATVTSGADVLNYYVDYAAATACNAPDFYIEVCGVSPAYNVITYFGDGSNITTPLVAASGHSSVHVAHSYSTPGNYWIKQVIRDGASRLDSVEYNYVFTSCIFPLVIYQDVDADCIKDATEPFNPTPVSVQVDSAGVNIAAISVTSSLYYQFAPSTPVGTVYSFRIIPSTAPFTVSCPASGVLTFTVSATANNYATQYFGTTCNASAFDLSVNGSAITRTNMATVNFSVRNNGYCTSPAATVTATLSPNYNWYSIYPTPTSVTGSTVVWNIGPVNAYSMITLTAYGLPPATLVPGIVTQTSASVTPTTGDVNTANNSVTINSVVTGAYDPNDKSVTPAGIITAGTELTYRIRFENMGNDTAHNIYVMDTLSDYLVLSSMKIITASAPMGIALLHDAAGHNVVKFDFPDIKLLDSSHHGLCDGVVIFSIDTDPGLADGTVIANKAAIYFDGNDPVITNTAYDTIGTPTAINNMNAGGGIAIYPNPANELLTIHTDGNAPGSYKIINSVGQLVMDGVLTGNNRDINISALRPGVYHAVIQDDTGNRMVRFVKM